MLRHGGRTGEHGTAAERFSTGYGNTYAKQRVHTASRWDHRADAHRRDDTDPRRCQGKRGDLPETGGGKKCPVAGRRPSVVSAKARRARILRKSGRRKKPRRHRSFDWEFIRAVFIQSISGAQQAGNSDACLQQRRRSFGVVVAFYASLIHFENRRIPRS